MIWQKLQDIHTHRKGRKEALVSLPSEVALQGCETPFSLELHPWTITAEKQQLFVEAARQLAGNPNLSAIGECGLDNQCGIPLDLQLDAFRAALHTAKRMDLPVIIHCVGYWAEMMACVKEARTQTNIIHGFRKGPQLAHQLLQNGFYISLGERFNPETAKIIPSERLLFETDESATEINQIKDAILCIRGIRN